MADSGLASKLDAMRCQACDPAPAAEDEPSCVLREMVSNILRHVAPEKLVRIDVDFKLDGSGKIDTTIGRAAHIRFLDSVPLTLNLLLEHKHCFAWED